METLKRILDLSKSKFNKDTEFEKALNLKPKTVDSWKRGNSKTYYQMLPLICSLLSVSSDYLLGLDTEPNRNSPLSEDKQRLLEMYDNLTDMEKGEILGELKTLTKGKFRVARVAAFGGGTIDVPISADVSADEINRMMSESEALQKQAENDKVGDEIIEKSKNNK